jgi:hypothetical protein
VNSGLQLDYLHAQTLAAGALLLWLLLSGCAAAPETSSPDTPEARAIAFLQREVPAWSRDNGCFSCHNNGDAARALYTARQQGHRVARSALADTTRWLAAPAHWDKNQGDPGFSDQRLAAVQFAAALLTARETGHLGQDAPLRVAAERLVSQQAPDGSWPVDVGNAAGSPATYGPVLATWMAWRVLQAVDTSGTRDARRRAAQWLEAVAPLNTPAAAVRLMRAPAVDEAALAYLRRAQTTEGGWGPYAASPAEVFDTALALLALAPGRAQPGVVDMIARGRAFLAAQQLADGSWPATTRPSGGVSYAQQMSTTGWATLALLATRPR